MLPRWSGSPTAAPPLPVFLTSSPEAEKGAVVKLQAWPMDCSCLLSLVIRNLVPPGNDFAF